MKKLLSALLCVMMVCCMMPGMAWATEGTFSPSSIDISGSLNYLKENLYNNKNLQGTSGGDYTVASAMNTDSAKLSELQQKYYVNVGSYSGDVTSITCGNYEYGPTDTFRLSVGNNVFITDKAFYITDNNLYVAAILIAPRESISINGQPYNLNISPAINQLSATSFAKWSGGGELSVSNVSGNTCTVTASGKNVKGALFIGIRNVTSDSIFITEKAYVGGGKPSYGFTKPDEQNGTTDGLAFYPFGWDKDLTDVENISSYDGAVLNYSIYVVGQGVCNATINYKVGGVKAEVGGKKYLSLEDAITNAADGKTITLLDDVTLDSMIMLHKSITLDLNGKKLNRDNGNSIVQVVDGATLTIDGTKAGSTVYGRINVGIAENNNGSVIMNGGTYSCTNNQTVLHINGTCKNSNVTISGVDITSPSDNGIQLNGAGTFLIENSKITGATAVYIKSGTTTIRNCTFTGTMDPTNYTYYGNGAYATGDAIVVDACNYPGGDPTVNIVSGSFTGTKAAVGFYSYNNGKGTISITGGTFSSNPTEYLANANYYVTGNGSYTVHYSAPYVPTTSTDNVTNSGSITAGNATTSADLSNTTTTTTEGGTTTTTAAVDKETADKIVDKAVENKSEEVVIDVTANTSAAAGSATAAQVEVPTTALEAIAEKTEADVTVKTDVAEVTLDNAAVGAVAEQAAGDTVQLIVEKVDENAVKVEFELKIVSSEGKVISDFKGGNVSVTVTVPKAMAEKEIVCVYIDENCRMSKVKGQKNADGTYTFITGHFSTYALMTAEEADAAIAEQTAAIQSTKIMLRSQQVKMKNGKKAIKLTWTCDSDVVFDGVEIYRSTKRYSGFGKRPLFSTTKDTYYNTSVKAGTKYYYKVRGYVEAEGEKIYTDYSTKAWRTVK